jgi:antitoxin component YwqK of YwqJK toxin-antitoxin module
LAHTNLNYLDGELDGYVRTYLTLKGQDSVLLYDLNFQNGLLQGESKAYHMSGRLAKKGFFLNGEPIEDYEAYDTLGFKYHYVKFQYSFPIEEKIWEENELSVRYLFDWRDSIYFQPTDITSTQSLDRVLANLGLAGDYYERPYYGRPSIVNKEGIDYHITKYYPNDTIARDGDITAGKKVGCWKYYSYDGEFLYEANYFDTIISINDSIQFKSKGILTDYDRKGNKLSESYIIEKFEKYDCSHTDHYEIRQLMTIWQGKDSVDRINGYVKNYYDNGVLQNEGLMKNGIPTGVWKFYDPFGKLNQVGSYTLGKRDGRWLGGDLSKTKYLGDICLNPNLPDLEEELKYREKQLDIVITNYQLGKALNKEFYDVNLNDYEEEEGESLESEE